MAYLDHAECKKQSFFLQKHQNFLSSEVKVTSKKFWNNLKLFLLFYYFSITIQSLSSCKQMGYNDSYACVGLEEGLEGYIQIAEEHRKIFPVQIIDTLFFSFF